MTTILMVARAVKQKKLKNNANAAPADRPQTFIEHVREFQMRLFIVALAFLLAAGLAYPNFDKIMELLTAPLRNSEELYYLTPAGAFSFIVQVCMFVGAIGALPVFIYQLYRFVMPAVRPVIVRTALLFTVASVALAAIGMTFAYLVSLPAALYFLSSFNSVGIQAMLTVDAYANFVMIYILAAAVLFQVPLILLIIDSVTPLTPKKLMGKQGHILLGSFIVAAIVSPTPDILNQSILAAPMVVMYQVGIIAVWIRHRQRLRAQRRVAVREQTQAAIAIPSPLAAPLPVTTALAPTAVSTSASAAPATVVPRMSPRVAPSRPRVVARPQSAVPATNATHAQNAPRQRPIRSMDIMMRPQAGRSVIRPAPSRPSVPAPTSSFEQPRQAPARPVVPRVQQPTVRTMPALTIDGFRLNRQT